VGRGRGETRRFVEDGGGGHRGRRGAVAAAALFCRSSSFGIFMPAEIVGFRLKMSSSLGREKTGNMFKFHRNIDMDMMYSHILLVSSYHLAVSSARFS
jgi:hypothetical protein